MPKVSALRIFILLVGLFALFVTGSYVIRGFPVKQRRAQECFICRTEVNTRVRFNVLRKTQTNTSALAAYLDRERLLHSHSFWPKVVLLTTSSGSLVGRPSFDAIPFSNLLKREKTKKRGIRGKQLNAGWDHAYLLRLLGD
jgi:hypothetical protein